MHNRIVFLFILQAFYYALHCFLLTSANYVDDHSEETEPSDFVIDLGIDKKFAGLLKWCNEADDLVIDQIATVFAEDAVTPVDCKFTLIGRPNRQMTITWDDPFKKSVEATLALESRSSDDEIWTSVPVEYMKPRTVDTGNYLRVWLRNPYGEKISFRFTVRVSRQVIVNTNASLDWIVTMIIMAIVIIFASTAILAFIGHSRRNRR